ncbi:Hypothetical protein NTJ_09386 [Nesidiocoris tenuis]|uniref:Gustatory receptor n=1 Tax=Nesidiocoris tenuis TaxID=355587 RepID=A0ABN7AYF5_9HEMI|nr:Hypothetical protein NTJ_09386 [Nesidiocoris tenuis]
MSKLASDSNCRLAHSLEIRLKRLQLFGTLPLTLEAPVFSKLSPRYLIISAILSSIVAYFLLFSVSYQSVYLRPLSAALFDATSCVYTLVPPTATLVLVKKRFVFESAVNELLAMRAKLGLGEARYPIVVKLYLALYGVLTTCSMVNIAVAIRLSPDLYSWMNIIDDACWDTFFAIMALTCSQFMFLIYSTGECFSRLMTMIPKKGQTVLPHVDIRRFIKNYDTIVDLAYEIFECYDIVVGETLLSNFTCMMAHGSALLISNIFNPFKQNEFSIWVPYHLFSLTALMITCVSISSKVSRVQYHKFS